LHIDHKPSHRKAFWPLFFGLLAVLVVLLCIPLVVNAFSNKDSGKGKWRKNKSKIKITLKE
jgi:hypothetical protein